MTGRVFFLGLALALAIGLSLGMLGGGGSILTVPMLHYVFGARAHDAIAMSLVIVGVTSAVALVPHVRAQRVQWRTGLVFGVASMLAAFAGGRLGAVLPGAVLIPVFAVIMLAAGGAMLLRSRRPLATSAPCEFHVGKTIAIGIGVGVLTGTLGAGGGFVIVPALTLVGGIGIRQAVATSLLVIAMNAFAGFAGTLGHATLDAGILLPVIAMAVAGSLVGARVAGRIAAAQLQRVFGWFVIVVGVFILAGELS